MNARSGRAFLSAAGLIAAVVCAAVLVAPAGVAAQKSGGTLRIAILGEPPALDPHWTTATLTEIIAGHYLEGLYTRDKNYQPVPMLAEGHTISPDDKVYTIRLRHGVIFHNGKEMTSEDVVASLNRWLKVATYGKALAPKVETIRATDKYAIEIRLKEPSAVLIPNLAFENNFAAIYPKEVAEAAGDKPNTQFIGTGPFKIVERQPDRFIKMVRHDKYVPRAEPATRLGRQEGRVRGHPDVDPDAGSRPADQRRRVGRGGLHVRRDGRRLWPAQGQSERPDRDQQAVLLARDGVQPEEGALQPTRHRTARRCARRCWRPSIRSR